MNNGIQSECNNDGMINAFAQRTQPQGRVDDLRSGILAVTDVSCRLGNLLANLQGNDCKDQGGLSAPSPSNLSEMLSYQPDMIRGMCTEMHDILGRLEEILS